MKKIYTTTSEQKQAKLKCKHNFKRKSINVIHTALINVNFVPLPPVKPCAVGKRDIRKTIKSIHNRFVRKRISKESTISRQNMHNIHTVITTYWLLDLF